jgi:hypothetical protein
MHHLPNRKAISQLATVKRRAGVDSPSASPLDDHVSVRKDEFA